MINWIISSGILIITIILLRSMFRNKISLRLQYALWFLVAVRLLIPLNFGSSVLSIENLTNQLTLQTQIERTTENNRQNTSNLNEYRDYENAVKIYEGVENTLSDSADIISEENIPKTETSRSQETISISEIVLQILFCTWITGIIVLGMVFIITNMRFRKRLIHTRRKLDVTYSNLPVYISKEVDSPCLFGIFRPCIYVTKPVAEDSMILRHSIYHETTHYKHGDMLWALIRCVCLAIHWYNPLVWWAAKLSKQDSELACDEATIARLGETERLAYGKTLIQLTCGKRNDLFSAATTMTSEKKSITERIKLIAKKPKIKAYALISIVLIMLITVVCAFTDAANKKAETEISEIQKNSQNNSDIETMDSDTANDNDESMDQPRFYTEAQENKVCLAVMPDGISKAGGDYRYLIPEAQEFWKDSYEKMKLLANGDGTWKEDEMSQGIWVVYNDEWTCLTDQGFIVNFSKRVDLEQSDANSFYNLCLAQAMSHDTGSPYRPEEIAKIVSASLVYNEQTYTITDSETLKELETNFAASQEIRGGAACPFTAPLILKTESGRILTIFLATDSCNTWLSDGVYYDYRGYEDIDEIYELFQTESTRMEKCILKFNDTLYYGTDEIGPMGDAGSVAGYIESSVAENETPTKNGESNFGCIGNSYTYDTDGGIMVFMDDEKWHWFYCLQEETASCSYLSDPLPGIPCENPADSGWDLKNAKDVRTKWSNMSYVPEEGTENDTYLIGKTKQFTLYGKGDFETMLLECNGKYAEIRHDYTSNYMTPLELMEMDFDEDGQNELSIKFNVKHGTGLYIDTFLLADFGLDNQLYVHQFLAEDFTAQLAEHLSFEKTEKGIQPLVEGKPAGLFAENENDMDSFSATSVGAQMRFYYNEIKNEVQLSGEIMLLIDGYPGNLWTSGNDITATVHWDGTHFYLSDFTSKNRSLDEQVYYALADLYDVPDLYYVDVRYDSAKMNQETMVISAEILSDENDSSYDYAEVHLKRAYTNYLSGWEIENIYLEK